MLPQWKKEFGSAEKMLSQVNRSDLLKVLYFSVIDKQLSWILGNGC